MCSSNPVTYWHVALHSYEKNYIKHFCNNMSHKSKNKSIFEVLQTEVSLYVRKLNVFWIIFQEKKQMEGIISTI